MSYMIEHLRQRRLDPSRYSGVLIDPADDAVTFLLWNLSGQCVGYQTYRPAGTKERNNIKGESKYYLMPGEEDPNGARAARKRIAVWGLETYRHGETLYVTEGVFDAAAIHALGLPAIAVLANDPKRLRSWLVLLPEKKVAVCDGDAAGRKLAKLADAAVFCPEGRDAANLPPQCLATLLSTV
jgi:hypothetical protein